MISQGRWDRGLGQEWAPSLLLQTAQPGAGWVAEGGPREANTDTFTPVVSRWGELPPLTCHNAVIMAGCGAPRAW